MRQRTTSKTKERKLSKVASGESYSVIIPIEFIRDLGWQEHQKLDITLDGDRLIIKDWKK